MTANELLVNRNYIISIKKFDITATGRISVVAHIKYKGQYATIEFNDRGWKIWHNGIPTEVILDAKNELWKRVQKIIEKINEILALGNGIGLTILFK